MRLINIENLKLKRYQRDFIGKQISYFLVIFKKIYKTRENVNILIWCEKESLKNLNIWRYIV